MASHRKLIPLIILLVPFVTHAAECEPRGFAIPIKGNKLSNGPLVRGLSLGAGSGNESLSVLPSAGLNYTYIYGPDNCPDEWPTGQCGPLHGGTFNTSLSKTYVQGKEESKLFDAIHASWTKDTISLESNIYFEDFEFGVRHGVNFQGEVNQAQIGLGRDSNFLNRLWDTGAIASKSYSFFFGTPDEIGSQPRDGFMTFGGYDKGFVGEAKNLTKRVSPVLEDNKCREGMLVEITGLDLTWKDGTVDKILEPETMQACIVPEWSGIIQMPKRYWDALSVKAGFEQAEGKTSYSDGLYYKTQIVNPRTAFDGTFTITLENSLSVTIPNDHFIFDEPRLDIDGKSSQNRNTKSVPIVATSAENGNENNMPQLGLLFFTQAYLFVNHDSSEFTVWAADSNAVQKQLVGIDTTNNCVAEANDSDPAGSIGTKGKTSGSIIAGVVIGVLVILGLIAGGAWWFWRRKQQQQALQKLPPAYTHDDTVKYAYSSTTEMDAYSPGGFVEMPGHDIPFEAPGHGQV